MQIHNKVLLLDQTMSGSNYWRQQKTQLLELYVCAHVSEGDSRRSKRNILVADINFQVNNKISSWQQIVELYFDENCWQNLQKQGFFSLC